MNESPTENSCATARLSWRRERADLAILAISVAMVPLVGMIAVDVISLLILFFFPTAESLFFFWCIGSLPIYLISMPVASFFARFVSAPPPLQRALSVGRLVGLCGLAVTLSFAISWLTSLLLPYLSFLPDAVLEGSVSSLALESPVWMTLLFSVVLAPIMEEWFYRGVIVRRLQRYGTLPAVLVGGLLFGLIHGNLQQCLTSSVVGCLLSYVYLYTGRLRDSILIHSILNLTMGVLPTEAQKLFLLGHPFANGLTVLYYAVLFLSLLLAIPTAVWLIRARELLPPVGRMQPREWVRATLLNPAIWALLACLILFFFI